MTTEPTRLRTLYGDMLLPDWPEDLICRSLHQCGEWAGAEVELLAPLVTGADVVWDVGAYLGTFSLGLSRLVRPARLLAIDANPEIQPFLRANLTANAPCPVEIVQTGVAQTAGWLTLRPGDPADNHGAQSYVAAEAGLPAMPCQTLRALRQSHGDYDVLKLDIEGMEGAALRGDLDYLRQHKPVIWAECNETPDSHKTFEVMKWLGYEPVYLAFPAFRCGNFNQSDRLIYPMAYEAALLAAPPGRLAKLTGLVAGEDIVMRPLATGFDLRRALWDTPRWAQADWLILSRPELIARLGRISKGQGLKDFLAV